MISLLKVLDLPWEQARGYLREDLDHLQAALNQRWAATFGDTNLLDLAASITGVLLPIHGGTGHSSYTLGDTLYASSPTVLSILGGNTSRRRQFLTQRGTGSVSAAPTWEDVTIPPVVIMPGEDGEDGQRGWPGAQGVQGVQGPMGLRGFDGEDGEESVMWPLGCTDKSSAFTTVNVAKLLTVDNSGIAITTTDGIVLQNSTAATVGTTVQWSPRLRFRGTVWDTDDAISKTYDWFAEAINYTGNNPESELRFSASLNGGTARSTFRLYTRPVAGSGSPVYAEINNNDNTLSGSDARMQAMVGGTSGGDPSFLFGISGAVNWSVGLDNSDSDKFKIGANASVGTSTAVTVDATLRMGIGVTSPTAFLHLLAGTATVNTAPLKFNSGTLLTAAEAGAVEFLTDAYYGTITTGAARKTFAFLESPSFTTPNIGAATGTSLSLSNTINLISTGGAATAGTAVMVLGTVTVNTTAMTATALLFAQRKTAGGTIGFATTYTQVNGTSFTLNSDSALDTSTFSWHIIETH